MKTSKPFLALVTLLAFGTLAGCSATSTKSTDSTKSAALSDSIRKSLDQANLKDVSASYDRSTGVVTLGGQVEMGRDKSEAESIVKSIAGGQAVSNQIAVIGAGHMGNHGPGRMGERGAGHMEDHSGERRPEPQR